jgi:uncharacterized membrane protein
MVSYKRHLAKSISYRILGTTQTIIISYMITGDISISTLFGGLELILKPILYFLHERIWYKYFKYGVKD